MSPGDDIRRVDWRLLRADRPLLRQAVRGGHQHQLLGAARRLEVDGVLQPRHRKLEYARFLAACLAYLAQRQRDRVGLITFDNDIVTHVPAVGQALQRRPAHPRPDEAANGAGDLRTPINKMAEHFRRRSVLVLISDFYEEPDVILEAIKPLRFLGNDLIVFHVLDPAEIDFGYDDASSFEDLESGEQIPGRP